MDAVSNTSPISNLAIIGRLDLLKSQFSRIIIPEAVFWELSSIRDRKAFSLIEAALSDGWIERRRIGNPRFAAVLGGDLHVGEAEAIALGVELRSGIVLIDEKEGRGAARRAGLSVIGVLGVLLRAKRSKQIQSVRREIESLRLETGFFIAAPLEAEILQAAGE